MSTDRVGSSAAGAAVGSAPWTSRRAGFTVVTAGEALRITPDSTGRARNLTRSDFERSVPLLGHAGRGEVNEASRNSSYVEAILADLGR
jgi:hypothetical protein